MNALTRQEASALPALTMDQAELMGVLRTSLYPGAQDESIKMALGYCKAAGLDPMQKPVHIVPMWDRNTKSMRDVIMPGIGLYRTQAARSGALAGISEPEFGPDITVRFGEMDFIYPDWCRVTVTRRMDDGKMATFTAREYWLENYATAGKDSSAPNAMWKKRPRGQIAKCAEAQALRKAFPEMTGSQPTSDEMEGKTDFDDSRTVDAPTRTVEPQATPATPAALTFYAQDAFDANLAVWKKVIAKGQKPDDVIAKVNSANAKTPLSADQEAAIRALAPAANRPSAAPTQLTSAQVMEQMRAAKDEDTLNTIMDLANTLTRTEDERVAEEACYDICLAALRE